MADISKLTRILAGVARQVDLATNTLVIDNAKVKLGGANHFTFSGTLTADRSIIVPDANVNLGHIASLVSLSGVSGGSVNLGAFTGTTIPDNQTIKQALQAIETALEGIAVSSVLDGDFAIQNSVDNTKQIAFDAAGIATGTTRTITMPDANVDLGDVNTAIQRDGSIAFTANQPMGGNKLTGLAQGTAAGDSVRYEQVILANGVNAFTAAQSMGSNKLTNLANGTATTDAAAVGQVALLDGSQAFTSDQSMGGNKLTNVADPTSAQDAATKAYVDLNLQGVKPKQAARVATTADITLSGLQTIDGVSVVAGNRVLVKDQTAQEDNGIYVAASGAWSRSADFDSLSPIDEINGAWIGVQEGTVNAGKVFIQYTQVDTLGTDPVLFTFFTDLSNLTGGDMITVSGGDVSVDLATVSGLVSTNPGNSSGQLAINFDDTTLDIDVNNKLTAKLSGTGALSSGLSGLAVSVDDQSVEINGSNQLAVKVSGVGGITIGAGLVANTDNTTLEVNGSNQIAIKQDGVNSVQIVDNAVIESKIASDAVTTSKIANNAVDESKIATTVAGDGLTGGGGVALAVEASNDSVSIDNTGISVNSAPAMSFSSTAGEAMAANTTFVVRWAVNGETEANVYKADNDASTENNFYAIGLIMSGTALAANDPVKVNAYGTHGLGSSDALFAAADIGKPVFLTTSGGFSLTAPTAADTAVVRIGIVISTSTIFVQPQVVGIN
jgi:hypothetical protein